MSLQSGAGGQALQAASPGTSGTSPGPSAGLPSTSAPREVADTALYFLQDEFIKYVFEVRTGGAALTAASKAVTLAEAEAAGKEASVATRDFGMSLLEETGFNIGLRLVEK